MIVTALGTFHRQPAHEQKVAVYEDVVHAQRGIVIKPYTSFPY